MKSSGVLTLHLVILHLFHSQKFSALLWCELLVSPCELLGEVLDRAEAHYHSALSPQRRAVLQSLLKKGEIVCSALWNSTSVSWSHYIFTGTIWCIGVYFITLCSYLVYSNRVVHLPSRNSWQLLFWLGLERLHYKHQKIKNPDFGRHTIPFCDYLRHSREVRRRITHPSP